MQDEAYVIGHCPLVQNIRERFDKPNLRFPECIIDARVLDDFKLVYEILKYFD